jgi:hypothetical protein
LGLLVKQCSGAGLATVHSSSLYVSIESNLTSLSKCEGTPQGLLTEF